MAPNVWTPWDPAQGPRSVVTPAQGRCPEVASALLELSSQLPPPTVCSAAAFTPWCLSPFPPTPLICCSVPRASRCVINNLEPMFMDSAISAAFKPITFLQCLHEGFLLSQLFCFIYSLLPASRRCAGTCCCPWRVPGGPGGIGGLRGGAEEAPRGQVMGWTCCGRAEPAALWFLLLPRRGWPGRPHRAHHHCPTQEHQRGGRHLGGDHGVRGQRQASSGGGDGDGDEDGGPPISSASTGVKREPQGWVSQLPRCHARSRMVEGGGGLSRGPRAGS